MYDGGMRQERVNPGLLGMATAYRGWCVSGEKISLAWPPCRSAWPNLIMTLFGATSCFIHRNV